MTENQLKIKYYIDKLEEVMEELNRLEDLTEDCQIVSANIRRKITCEINKFYEERE